MKHFRRDPPYRPVCMQALGLLPPYSVEDVRKAYQQRARSLHPDAGGDPEMFKALRTAYQQALDLASFHASRRNWMGEQVECYVERLDLMAWIRQLGGECLLRRGDDAVAEYGPDFADVLRQLVTVRLVGPAVDDMTLQRLGRSPAASREVRLLVLAATNITDDGLAALAGWDLRGLDVSRTRISIQGLSTLLDPSRLEWLNVAGSRVGLLDRVWLRKAHPELTLVTKDAARPPRFDSPKYEQTHLTHRLAHVLR